MADILKNIGILLMVWAGITFVYDPFLENVRWRYITAGLFAVGSLLVTIAVSIPQ